MKTFLIPTTFESDTNKAIRVAADMFSSHADRILLFSTSEISNSITELLFLSSSKSVDLGKRQEILDDWSTYKKKSKLQAELLVHHQYGLSRPVFDTILERFDVTMSVVPESFQQSKEHIHQFTLKLLHQSKCPMMLLPGKLPGKGIQRALYLDETPEAATATVQAYPFHVIHKSMISKSEYPSVQSMVEGLNIDLLVKGKRIEGTTKAVDQEIRSFGLPVLAV